MTMRLLHELLGLLGLLALLLGGGLPLWLELIGSRRDNEQLTQRP